MKQPAIYILQGVRRGPVAALLILIGMCAGLAPLSGSSAASRDAAARILSVRGAASAASAVRASDRASISEPARVTEPRAVILPPPPLIVAILTEWAAPALFPAETSFGLQDLLAHHYRARAPPAI